MLALTNATLIDGTGRPPVGGATIVVDGKRISEAGPGLSCPEGVASLDLTGHTVMPGLIDCHVHIGGFITDRAEWGFSIVDSIPFLWDYFRSYARRRKLALENGVTSIRSAGDNHPHVIQLRRRIDSGAIAGPRISAPGPIFTAPGGHPASTIYRKNRYIVEHATRQVGTAMSARAEVGRLAAEGVDCIKAVYSSTNPMDTAQAIPRLGLDVLEALADEAHRYGLRLMVHTGTPDEMRGAVSAGADSIEHGVLPGGFGDIPEGLVQTMRDKGTFYVPILAPAWAFNRQHPDALARTQQALKLLHDGGVKVALGTDSGFPAVVIGRGVHRELELMVGAGLSPMDAIVTATKNAAENLDKGAELGTIEPGKLADIIAVSGDPLESIANTRNVALVIKDGEVLVNRIKPPR